MSKHGSLTDSANEAEMSRAYAEQSQQVLASRDRFMKIGDRVLFGAEVEYGLIDDERVTQVDEKDRDAVIGGLGEAFDIEMGAAQLEIKTTPVDLRETPSSALRQLIASDDAVFENAQRINGKLRLVRHGTNPFVQISRIARSSFSKYQLVPNFHNSNRRRDIGTMVGSIDQVDVGDAAIIGITNSVQANVEAASDIDAIDKLNRSFQIGPMVMSMFGNARFLEAKDTGVQDIRMIGWEMSHDTRTLEQVSSQAVTRVGLPRDYYASLEDYFEQVGSYPFIIDAPDNALAVGIGLNWRDTRVKVVGDSLVVEFRPVSTQSTPEENYAAMLFYVGRLLWSQDSKEELLSMSQVMANRNAAMMDGNRASLFTNVDGKVILLPATDALEREVKRAEDGLRSFDIFDDTVNNAIDLLKSRIGRDNPSRELARIRRIFMGLGCTAEEATLKALEDLKGIR